MRAKRATNEAFASLKAEAIEQRGLFGIADVERHGITPSQLRTRIGRGEVERLGRGVYRFPDLPEAPDDVVAYALSRLGPDALASHVTALALHGLSDIPLRYPLDVTVPRSLRYRKLDRVRIHAPRVPIDNADRVAIGPAILATSIARTVLDCVDAHVAPEQVQMALSQAVLTGRLTAAELQRAGAGRRGPAHREVFERVRELELVRGYVDESQRKATRIVNMAHNYNRVGEHVASIMRTLDSPQAQRAVRDIAQMVARLTKATGYDDAAMRHIRAAQQQFGSLVDKPTPFATDVAARALRAANLVSALPAMRHMRAIEASVAPLMREYEKHRPLWEAVQRHAESIKPYVSRLADDLREANVSPREFENVLSPNFPEVAALGALTDTLAPLEAESEVHPEKLA